MVLWNSTRSRYVRFRIYYEDREPYSGDPFVAPQVGVLAIALEDVDSNRGYRVVVGDDAWFWNPEIGWRGCDTPGMWDYLMMFNGPKALLFGRMVRNDVFHAAVTRARKEGLGDVE
jgi:hypothetical protein